MSNVLSIFHRASVSQDWSQQELAEFYRVENALLQSGFAVTTERGVSDEGDPWFVFCREDNQDVIAHFARIGHEYLVISSFHQGTLRGRDFRALVRDMLESHPLMVPMRRRQGQKVYLHPAALLAALVASAYVVSSEKVPGDSGADGHGKNASIACLLMEKFSAIAAAVLAAAWVESHSQSLLQYFDTHLLHALSDEKASHVASDSQFDTALHTAQNVELGAHRASSSDTGNVTTAHEAHATGAVLTNVSLPSISSPLEKGGASNSPANSDGGGQLTDGSHTDSSVAGTDQSAGVPRNPAAELIAATESQAAATQSVQSSYGAVSSDAFQVVASELSNSSAKMIVLSSGATPLNQALQEAFQQVGFDPGLAHNLTGGQTEANAGSNTTSQILAASGSTNSGAGGADPSNDQPSTQLSPYSVVQTDPQGHIDVTYFGVAMTQVTHNVETFLLSTPSYEVTLSGANVVIIDTNVADAKSAHFGVMTWDMSDGSTLSIVGIISAHAQSVTA
jgi:hypothetical protein